MAQKDNANLEDVGFEAAAKRTPVEGTASAPSVSAGLTSSEEKLFGMTDAEVLSAEPTTTSEVVTTTEPVDPAAAAAAKAAAAKKTEDLSDAYQVLETEMTALGLGSLVTDAKDLLLKVTNVRDMPAALRNTPDYKKRFIANEARILKGLKPLTPAEYLDKEDAYQDVMRQYGLPESYWKTDKLGGQEGFSKLLENNVSAIELEDRIQTAQDRVLNANKEVATALKQFYPDITNGDILAYTLDPKNAIKDIQRKVTAAEIGGSALQAGLNVGQTPEQIAQYAARATELAGAGVTKAQAQQGFQTVAEVAPRGGQLAEIYKQTPYTQQTAEAEVFGLGGSVEAAKQRKKLAGLEKAAFSTSTGMAKGALDRERAGNL